MRLRENEGGTVVSPAGGAGVGAGGCVGPPVAVDGVMVATSVVGCCPPPVAGVVVSVGATVVELLVPLLGTQPGCGMQRERVPVMQKHRAQVTLGGFQNWAILQVPWTNGGTK